MALWNPRITHVRSHPLPRGTQKPARASQNWLVPPSHVLHSGTNCWGAGCRLGVTFWSVLIRISGKWKGEKRNEKKLLDQDNLQRETGEWIIHLRVFVHCWWMCYNSLRALFPCIALIKLCLTFFVFFSTTLTVSIFIDPYNPFMDLVTLISSGVCLGSKSLSCFAFPFPSVHSNGIAPDN